MDSDYRIDWADGRPAEFHPYYDEALDSIRKRYPKASIGHPYDISEGGHQTFAWRDENVRSDPGAKPVATIRWIPLAPINSW